MRLWTSTHENATNGVNIAYTHTHMYFVSLIYKCVYIFRVSNNEIETFASDLINLTLLNELVIWWVKKWAKNM